jgi:hypothetical protein
MVGNTLTKTGINTISLGRECIGYVVWDQMKHKWMLTVDMLRKTVWETVLTVSFDSAEATQQFLAQINEFVDQED